MSMKPYNKQSCVVPAHGQDRWWPAVQCAWCTGLTSGDDAVVTTGAVDSETQKTPGAPRLGDEHRGSPNYLAA
jgi:hypothetical protein